MVTELGSDLGFAVWFVSTSKFAINSFAPSEHGVGGDKPRSPESDKHFDKMTAGTETT
jgi:hypothetical protein